MIEHLRFLMLRTHSLKECCCCFFSSTPPSCWNLSSGNTIRTRNLVYMPMKSSASSQNKQKSWFTSHWDAWAVALLFGKKKTYMHAWLLYNKYLEKVQTLSFMGGSTHQGKKIKVKGITHLSIYRTGAHGVQELTLHQNKVQIAVQQDVTRGLRCKSRSNKCIPRTALQTQKPTACS